MSGDDIFHVARKMIYWMIAGVVIAVVVLAFTFMIGGYRNKLTQIPPELRAELLALRFTNNAECFAVHDENTGAVMTNTIDLSRFNQEIMDKCYRTEEEKGLKTFNFRLRLKNEGQEVITNNYFHKDDFTLTKEVLVKKEGQGKGKFVQDQLVVYVQEKI